MNGNALSALCDCVRVLHCWSAARAYEATEFLHTAHRTPHTTHRTFPLPAYPSAYLPVRFRIWSLSNLEYDRDCASPCVTVTASRHMPPTVGGSRQMCVPHTHHGSRQMCVHSPWFASNACALTMQAACLLYFLGASGNRLQYVQQCQIWKGPEPMGKTPFCVRPHLHAACGWHHPSTCAQALHTHGHTSFVHSHRPFTRSHKLCTLTYHPHYHGHTHRGSARPCYR